MRPCHVCPIVIAVTLLALPAPARAQAGGGMFGAFVGTTRNAKAEDVPFDNRFTWGLTAGTLRTVGFEFDFGMTRDFFASAGDEDEFEENNLLTATGNLLISVPIDRGGRGLRPYAVGGIGLMKSRVSDLSGLIDFSRNDFAMDLGFGAIGFASPGFGIRGDLRYFRRLSKEEEGLGFDLGDISFWRLTVGGLARF